MSVNIPSFSKETTDSKKPSQQNKSKRLIKELNSLQTDVEPSWSVELYDPDDMRRWKLILEGPTGTPYEHGKFQLTVSFPPEYQFKPPNILFDTKIFHPNINSQGAICISILNANGGYKPTTTVRTILKEIQKLLENSNFDDFISPEAAFLFKADREKFRKKAVEWTRKYAHEGAKINSSIESSRSNSPELQIVSEPVRKTTIQDTFQLVASLEAPNINMSQENNSQATTDARVVWLWKSIVASAKASDWQLYSDVEITILDRAYMNREKIVELDHYIIDFDQGFQLNKSNRSVEATIIRSIDPKYKARLRRRRHAAQQLTANVAFYGGEYREQIPIITQCLSLNTSITNAAAGIRREGAIIGRPIAANHIAEELEQIADDDQSLIGMHCIYQYTRDSFLNGCLNKFLRDEDPIKVDTLGPFFQLLFTHFKDCSFHVYDMIVYRGVNLQPSDIKAYQRSAGKGTYRWLGFSSTSKRKEVGEFYDANTLMIINLNDLYPNDRQAVDIGTLSQFPQEEEVLLKAGVRFSIEKVAYDEEKKKHHIYIDAYV